MPSARATKAAERAAEETTRRTEAEAVQHASQVLIRRMAVESARGIRDQKQAELDAAEAELAAYLARTA